MSRQRIVSKSDVLVLNRPKSRRHPQINVRVSVDRGILSVKSMQKKCVFFKPFVNTQHDLKTVWVNDMLDDECSGVRNCFNVVTPERSYILQANSHRAKIEWMQDLSIAVSQSLKFRGSYRPSSWNNLEDLQIWLNVREVQYHFQSHKQYKGAVYTGKWNAGMPHVCGSLKWPNGDRYDGEFMFGKFQGSGTMLWLSDKHMRSYTGRWTDGKMEEHGEMVYADQSVYTGWWHMGKRHGHGRMEYKQTDSVYIGSWEADARSGYGVFDNGTKSERYLGMWLNDKYNGAGILVAQNKIYYSGIFTNGEKNSDDSSVARMVVQDDKWVSLFSCCTAMLEQMVSICHSMPDIYHSNGVGPSSSVVGMEPDSIAVSPDMDANCQTCNSILKGTEECVACRVEGFRSADHPLGILVNNLTKCFLLSYSGVGIHRNLLPHAIGELCSITVRLHQLVRTYCPSVITMDENHLIGRPRTQLSLMLKSKKGLHRTSSNSPQGGSMDPSWLYPILLPSIFPTLFALYKECHSEDDYKLSTLMETLNQSPDKELCSLLGLQSEYKLWEKLQSDKTFSAHLGAAIEIFQNIGHFLTPLNKLLCVQEAKGEITQTFKTFTENGMGSPVLYTTEDWQLISTGLFSLVIIRSQVENLYSEIQFIQDFAGTTLLTEEYGFLLTQLKDCYYQIKDLPRE